MKVSYLVSLIEIYTQPSPDFIFSSPSLSCPSVSCYAVSWCRHDSMSSRVEKIGAHNLHTHTHTSRERERGKWGGEREITRHVSIDHFY